MSKQANKTVIGIFVVGASALAIAAVLILGSGKFFKQTLRAVCYFEGSVGGLNVGAPVVFRGVRIGSVTNVGLCLDTAKLIFTIPVYVELDPDKIQTVGPVPKKLGEHLSTFVERGLRAMLEIQSLVTGQMQVGLDFYPDKPAKFAEYRIDTKTPEIPTIPTPMQEMAKKIQQLPIDQIFKKIDSTLDGLDRIVNAPELMQTLRSISEAAGEAKDTVKKLNAKIEPTLSGMEAAVKDGQKLIQNIDSQVQPVSSELQLTLKDAQKVLSNLEEKVTVLASSVDEGVKDIQKLVRNVDGEIGPVATSLKSTLASIEKAVDEAGVTLRQAQQTLKFVEGDGADSELVYELNQALRDVRTLAKAIRGLADTLDRQPESAIFGKKILTGR